MRVITRARRRAEVLGTASKIMFALAALPVAVALLALTTVLVLGVPAWALAILSGHLTKCAHEAWDSLTLEEQRDD